MLKEGMVGGSAGGLEPSGVGMRAEPCILRVGLMRSRPSPRTPLMLKKERGRDPAEKAEGRPTPMDVMKGLC